MDSRWAGAKLPTHTTMLPGDKELCQEVHQGDNTWIKEVFSNQEVT